MIRKFCRNLLLRSLILAVIGDRTAVSVSGDPPEVERNAPVAAMHALNRQEGSGWQLESWPVAAYQIVSGNGF